MPRSAFGAWTAASITTLLLFASSGSRAQQLPQECMRSIAVKPNALIVHWGWIPGAGSFTSPLSCTNAELLREKLFTSGSPDAWSPAQLDQARQDADPKAAVLADLDALSSAINDKPPSQLRLVLDVQLLVFSKNTLIYCFVSETGWGLAVCGVGVIQFIVSAYDFAGKLGTSGDGEVDKQQALALIAKTKADLVQTNAKPAPVSSSVALSRMHDAQVGLCREILQTCVKP